MKRRGEPYSLSRRKNVDGTFVFTVRFRKDDGSWGSPKSTLILDNGKPRDRDRAVAWAENYLSAGQVTHSANTTLADYGAGFFDWDAEYARNRVLRGKRYSREQADLHDKAFQKWIAKDKIGSARIETIDSRVVAAWQLRLASVGLAPKTIHQRTMTLRILLKAAYSAGLLRSPIVFEPVSGAVKNQRGMLTMQEAAALFALPWTDQRYMAGNLVAAVTGLRAGEICGLRASRVFETHVAIVGTWRPKTGILSDTTKGGKARLVPVPAEVGAVLLRLIQANPWQRQDPDPFVFWSLSGKDRAMDQRELTEALHQQVDAVNGAGAAQARRIGMHSWRAFANTAYVEASVPAAMIQRTIGHTSDSMTALYYRPQALAPVRAVQDDIVQALRLTSSQQPPAPASPGE
jgi:integrase